jgi:SAM-dependent methyltransferase
MTDQPAPAVPAAASPAPHYLPAMGRRWLLPLYDPFTRLIGAGRVHGELLDRAEIGPGSRVLEIGCGTGNLLLLAKRRCPDAEVTGLDPDPAALRRTRRKADRAGLAVRLDRGFASDLPYPDASVDRVLSALMLHHLDPADLPRALAEVRRVLRPGGSLHVVDIVGGHRAHGPLGWLARRSRHLEDGSPERLTALLADAGLRDVARTGQRSTPMGAVAFYRAAR